MPDLQELSSYYASLSDGKLLELADEAGDLRPEAVTALRDELRRRGLDSPLVEQLQELSTGGVESLAEQFRQLPCPRCGSVGQMVNAFKIATTMSFLVMTQYKEETVLGCPACVKSAAKEARLTTLLAGWWGIPWGPVRSLDALDYDSVAIAGAEQREATGELLDYVRRNFQEIKSLLNH